MSASPLNLIYENPPSRGRRWLRRAILPAILLVLVTIAVLFAPASIRRLQLVSAQRRAMAYSPAADHVVYETDPARAKQLMHGRGDYAALNSSGVPVIEFAAPWRDFYRLAEPPGRKPAAVLFLHERRNPAGRRRLVAVDTSGSDNEGPLTFRVAVFRPGEPWTPPGLLTTSSWTAPDDRSRDARIIRIFAGQFDPRDQSHFSITYQTAGGNGTVDGWLLDDEQVTLELRKPLSGIGFP